jgi:hypothetical protein
VVNQDRVRLMTQAAILKKHSGKEIEEESRYHKWSYTAFHIINNIVGFTAAYLIAAILLMAYFTGQIFSTSFIDNIRSYLWILLTPYLLLVLVYIVTGTVHYGHKYDKDAYKLKHYHMMLTEIEKLEENKGQAGTDE